VKSLLTFQFFALPILLSGRRRVVTRKHGTGKLGNISHEKWELYTQELVEIIVPNFGYSCVMAQTKPFNTRSRNNTKENLSFFISPLLYRFPGFSSPALHRTHCGASVVPWRVRLPRVLGGVVVKSLYKVIVKENLKNESAELFFTTLTKATTPRVYFRGSHRKTNLAY